MLGPAPVVDFDGTLARLEVPWPELRRAVGVDASIDELWSRADQRAWEAVREAEVAAATLAEPVMDVLLPLEDAQAVAILTSNSEQAVRAFLDRFARLDRRVAVVVGRETLGGNKKDFDVFSRGLARCVDATTAARGDEPIVYVGDAAYEIEFARRLGARAVSVAELERTA
jgi:phosphoglycolate phosphatase-like HAD superfamily hydrolase